MKVRHYGYGLGITLLLALITLWIAAFNPIFSPHLLFYGICLLTFLAFAAIAIGIGLKTNNHRDPGLFGTAVLAIMTFKMIFSIFLVVIYVRVYADPDKWFVLPFFLMYLYFTIFEAWALIHIGRTAKTK